MVTLWNKETHTTLWFSCYLKLTAVTWILGPLQKQGHKISTKLFINNDMLAAVSNSKTLCLPSILLSDTSSCSHTGPNRMRQYGLADLSYISCACHIMQCCQVTTISSASHAIQRCQATTQYIDWKVSTLLAVYLSILPLPEGTLGQLRMHLIWGRNWGWGNRWREYIFQSQLSGMQFVFVICCLVVVLGDIIDWEVGTEVLVVVWMWVICKFNLS